jgi:hypothetical protein
VSSQLWDALDVPRGDAQCSPPERDQIGRVVREKRAGDSLAEATVG